MKKLILMILMSSLIYAGDQGGSGGSNSGNTPAKGDKRVIEAIKDLQESLPIITEITKKGNLKVKFNSQKELKEVADTLIEEDAISNKTYSRLTYSVPSYMKKKKQPKIILIPIK